MPDAIQITGVFTAQTNEEARYMLAVFKFLRAATMIEYGTKAAQQGKAGTPPPVLRFNYMGAHMFNNTPVVVAAVNYVLEDTLDYVEVQLPGSRANSNKIIKNAEGLITIPTDQRTYMPTRVNITTTLQIQPNPKDVRDNFSLEDFKNGNLIGKGFV